MKLHSNTLTDETVRQALRRAQAKGNVADDVYMVEFVPGGSRSRARRWEVQLGTNDKTSGPSKSRHYKNSGQYGGGQIWAATYDEWGWFIAELFVADPEALFGTYLGVDSFNQQTNDKYVL